jgi:hypothetical protein
MDSKNKDHYLWLKEILEKQSWYISQNYLKLRDCSREREPTSHGLNWVGKIQSSFMPWQPGITDYIAVLKSDEDLEATLNDQKAARQSFKNRLGKSNNCDMMFDVASMLIRQDLSNIDEPFTKEEIDNIINDMSNDISP